MTIRELRFLTDENIDYELIDFLRKQGFDVFDIKEKGLFRLPDLSILELALDQERAVITQDSDFGTLIFRDNMPFFGVIYLQPGHQSPKVHVESMTAILQSNLEPSIPFILVAENSGVSVRIRLRNL